MKRTLALALFAVALAPAAFAQAPPAAPVAADAPYSALPYSPSLDLTSMDRSLDPCADFYAYSCNGWEKRNPIPADQASWSVYGKLYEDNQRFLWGLLQEAARADRERSAVEREIGDYFQSCMDLDAIERAGLAPLKGDLDAISALSDKRGLAALIGRLQATGGGGRTLFGFTSEQDYEDSSRVIARAGAGGLGLPDRSYYLDDDARTKEIRDAYRAHVARLFGLAGAAPEVAGQRAEAVLRFETALAQASLSRVERRDPYKTSHKMKLPDLEKITPSFAWSDFLAAIGVSGVTEANVTEPKFYERVERRIREASLDDWRTYLTWAVLNTRAPYSTTAFREANFDFYSKKLRGTPQMPARWKQCVGYVDRDLGDALGQVFVAKAFPPEAKARTLDMTQRIEKAMELRIEELPWMSPETKKQALLKLHGMRNKIGYPDKWLDYSSIRLDRGDFAGNAGRTYGFELHRQLAKIGKPVDRGEWGMSPPTVNAYYDAQMNDINFPAGVLLPPLFDPKLDDAPNYGNTGGTIGHELTHGFDDEGRQYDAQGNLRDWWTAADGTEFKKRAQCVVDQYAQYTVVDDIKINSQLTLGEDVADLGGEILAYIAWKDATKGQDLKPIDGLTPDQRFFVGYAQWVCNSDRPENLRVRAKTDPHSPGRYRINGVVVNMPEFARAFDCKPGQPMVKKPEEICRIW